MTLGKIKSDRLFVLASSSPRRKKLLSELLNDFDVIPSNAEELQPGSLSPKQLVKENALIKSKDIATLFPEAWVLGADTLVALGDEVFGKPKDIEDAVASLLKLSGRQHSVFTGIALSCEKDNFYASSVVESKVIFKELDEKKIREYFSKVNPLDKAGSYAIQEHGNDVVEYYEGSLNNIIGLPTEYLRSWLLEVIV